MSYEVSDPEHRLHWMILKGDIDRAEELLEEDRNIDVDRPFFPDCLDDEFYEYHGKLPIHLALMQKNLPFVQLLARYDASGTECARGSLPNELFPAEQAAQDGYLPGLQCLSSLYPDLWNKWLSFRTALKAISPTGNAEALDYCLQAVKPHIKWNAHHTQSLLRKAESQDVSQVFATYLVENLDIDLNEEETPVDDDGFEYDRKALTKPINYSDYGLSDNFARSVHIMQLYNSLPLHRVAYLGRLDLVDLYLEHGANPMKRNSHGLTAFDAATDNRAEPRTKTHEIILKRLNGVVQKEAPNLVVFTPKKRRLEKS